jgi:hypothetical protein
MFLSVCCCSVFRDLGGLFAIPGVMTLAFMLASCGLGLPVFWSVVVLVFFCSCAGPSGHLFPQKIAYTGYSLNLSRLMVFCVLNQFIIFKVYLSAGGLGPEVAPVANKDGPPRVCKRTSQTPGLVPQQTRGLVPQQTRGLVPQQSSPPTSESECTSGAVRGDSLRAST